MTRFALELCDQQVGLCFGLDTMPQAAPQKMNMVLAAVGAKRLECRLQPVSVALAA